MKLASRSGVGFWEKTAFRCFRARKRLRQRLRYRPGQDKTVLLIVGCQRSGTSMLHHLFRRDPDVVTYDEISPLSTGDPVEGLRWNPWPEVRQRILTDRAPLVVCKPLVESQNLLALLDLFPRSRAIWMYRDFHDVVLSNLEYFGDRNGHQDLQPILTDDQTNWRSEHLSAAARQVITELYSPDLPAADAAALFWYARNSLFPSGALDADERVQLCNYDDVVARPAATMAAIYRFIGRPYPGDQIVGDVFSGSRGRGRTVELTPPVVAICAELQSRLDDFHRLQSWAGSSQKDS